LERAGKDLIRELREGTRILGNGRQMLDEFLLFPSPRLLRPVPLMRELLKQNPVK
jgi:hypothetical protein